MTLRTETYLIKVYKQTWHGPRLAGWMDDEDNTHKAGGGPEGRLIHWLVDSDGSVYYVHDKARGLIGWVTTKGAV